MGTLSYTAEHKVNGATMGCARGISQREAEDFIEKLRLNPDIEWVAATFVPDPVQI